MLTLVWNDVGVQRGEGETAGTERRRAAFMQDPVLVRVLDYWERLRDGRLAPPRAELDPREIADALDHTFILELTRADDIRFRLSGMALNGLMGMDLRSMPGRALFGLGSRAAFEEVVRDLLAEPKVVELRLRAAEGEAGGTGAVRGRMLLLPMLNDRGEMTRVLGCLRTEGRILAHPQRFEIVEVATTRIVAESRAARPRPAGLGEAPAPFDRGGRERRRHASERPYLRLVRNEKE